MGNIPAPGMKRKKLVQSGQSNCMAKIPRQRIDSAAKILLNKNFLMMDWEEPSETNEPINEKQVCQFCGNDTFRVYIKVIIDDARLYCAKCGKFLD